LTGDPPITGLLPTEDNTHRQQLTYIHAHSGIPMRDRRVSSALDCANFSLGDRCHQPLN